MNAADWFMVGLACFTVVFSFFSLRFLRRSEREYTALALSADQSLRRAIDGAGLPTHDTIEEALRQR